MMNENLSNTARSVKTGLERIPSLTVAGDSGLPGNFYLSFISVPAVIQLDGRGNVVWADELSAKTEPIRDSCFLEFPRDNLRKRNHFRVVFQTGRQQAG